MGEISCLSATATLRTGNTCKSPLTAALCSEGSFSWHTPPEPQRCDHISAATWTRRSDSCMHNSLVTSKKLLLHTQSCQGLVSGLIQRLGVSVMLWDRPHRRHRLNLKPSPSLWCLSMQRKKGACLKICDFCNDHEAYAGHSPKPTEDSGKNALIITSGKILLQRPPTQSDLVPTE